MVMLARRIGTFDHARPVEQMQAIDLALRHYFNAIDWLRERDRARRRG